MKERTEVCMNCKHYMEFGDDDETEPQGECRRYPPSVHFHDDGKMRAHYIEVFPLQWCGEFIKRVDEDAQRDFNDTTPRLICREPR